MHGLQRGRVGWSDDQRPGRAQARDGTDAHLTVIESATGQEYDFLDASISRQTISAGSGSVVDTNTGNGLGARATPRTSR